MSDLILDALRSVCGPSSTASPVSLHEPDLKDTKALDYVRDCIETGWVSTAGLWVNRFEQHLCDITGSQYAVAVSNGTVALRLALHLVDVRPGDEVFLPSLTFVATANAISHLGAIPHFIDIEPNTLGMSPDSLLKRLQSVAELRNGNLINRSTGRRLAAVLPVHIFGNPSEVANLRTISDSWGLPMVEDAAEALASRRNGIHCGLFGDVGTLSFNGNKLITTGGGGALLTNDSRLAQRARHLSTTAKVPHPWEFNHDAIGWNDRLPNLNAALGVAQLEVLQNRLNAKRLLYDRYSEAFSNVPGVALVNEPLNCTSNNWLITLRFTDSDPSAARVQRNQVLKAAHAVGFLLRPVWRLLHELPMYNDSPRDSQLNALDQSVRLLNLPSSPQLIAQSLT